MDSSAKRKNPTTNGSDDRHVKRSKGGSAGRWQTPYQKARFEAQKGKGVEVGAMGFWTTCVRGKERKALEELVDICEEYTEKMYGIKRKREDPADAEDEKEDDDIESSIKKEVEGMKPKPTDKPDDWTFEATRMDIDCVIFMRTRAPIDPVNMVHQICVDAKAITDKSQRRTRFINRFTPVMLTEKANESGLEEVAKKVLSSHFRLAGEEGEQTAAEPEAYWSYAIRPSFRAHNQLKRDDVIKKVASLIDSRHKVDLSTPDKVILIDVFQTYCGMSVVNGDYQDLNRYNLHEIYLSALKSSRESKEEPKEEPKGEETQETAKSDG